MAWGGDQPERTKRAYLDPRKVFHDPEVVKEDASVHSVSYAPVDMQEAWERQTSEKKRANNTETGQPGRYISSWDADPSEVENIRRAVNLEPTDPDSTLSDYLWEGPLPKGTPPLDDVQFFYTDEDY